MSDSFELIQSATNNNMRRAIQTITDTPGAVESSFEVSELSVMKVDGTEEKYLKVSIGLLVFPNGDIFDPTSYNQLIPVSKKIGNQYLVAKFIQLREDIAKYYSGINKTGDYYYRRNGIMLYLTSSPGSGGNELSLSRVLYEPGSNSVTLNDMRSMFSPHYKGTSTISMNAIVRPVSIRTFDDYVFRSGFLVNNIPNIINNASMLRSCIVLNNPSCGIYMTQISTEYKPPVGQPLAFNNILDCNSFGDGSEVYICPSEITECIHVMRGAQASHELIFRDIFNTRFATDPGEILQNYTYKTPSISL